MHERSRPLEPEQLFGRFMTAGRIDHVTRFLRADKSVQPSRTAPHAPTRFVGRDLRCGTQVFTKLFVGRIAMRGRTEGRTDAGTSGETQLGEQRAQQSDALAVRQAELLMEDRQQRHALSARVDWPPRLGPSRSASRVGLVPCDRNQRTCRHARRSVDRSPSVGSRSDTEPRHAFRSRVDRRKRGSSEATVRRRSRRSAAAHCDEHAGHVACPTCDPAASVLPTGGPLRERRRLPFAAATFFFQRGRRAWRLGRSASEPATPTRQPDVPIRGNVGNRSSVSRHP